MPVGEVGAPSPRCAVVVDPLGTGQDYPAAFAEAGVSTVAVLAAPESLADPFYAASWRPERFRQVHEFDGDLAGLAATLRRYRPLCLVPGAETGVELADALSGLVLPGTGNAPVPPGEPSPRRDKGAMARALERAGLPRLRQICSADPGEIDDWLRETGLAGGPLVVKPPKSAGTDAVYLVPRGADWRGYFDRICGRRNLLGLRNDAVLVSEYADGPEFMLDSYSVAGRHGLVDVCRYAKSHRGDRLGAYDLVEFLPPTDPAVHRLWPYVRRVLDAVGVRNGCAHTEVILTAGGPRLLEVGARPAGGGHQMITELATGTNQLRRTVDHVVRGEFQEGYRLLRHVCSVVLNAPVAGVWRNAELFDGVAGLATYHAHAFDYTTGDLVPAGDGLATYLGWVVLTAPDRESMLADYHRLKELEKKIQIDPAGQPVSPAGATIRSTSMEKRSHG